MIDVKECIKFCIENFTAEEATERLYKFFNESLDLKEKEIELRNSIKIPDVLKEPTIEYLKDNIEAIYRLEYNPCEGKNIVYVDPSDLKANEKFIIDRFWNKNRSGYKFVFQNKNYPCKGY